MIDLYYWTTPNGHKITMFLQEAELPYRVVWFLCLAEVAPFALTMRTNCAT